jgi:curli biogenesis system outer membrane secretion channel CsgG
MKFNYRYLIGFLCVISLSFSVNLMARAQLEFVNVEIQGVGDSLQEAVNTAVAEAIGRVNGKSVAATNAINKITESASDGKNKSFQSSTNMQRQFSEATKGVVDSYPVLSETQNGRGQYVVTVNAKIAKLKLSASASRLKIAVLPFAGSDRFARNFSDALVGKLVGSRRFTVLDRQNMADIAGERSVAATNSLTPVSELARLGSTLSADYIIVGKVEDVASQIREVYFPTIKKTFKIPEGKATVNFKIIDVATSQVKFADNAILGFDRESFEKAMGAGMRPNADIAMAEIASSKIGTQILDAIYPIMVVAVNRGVLTLNQGGDLVEAGAVYGVYERGPKVYDPYTKESLGRSESKVGELKVERVTPKMSSASLAKGDLSIFKEFKIGKFVCRLEKSAPSRAQQNERIVREKIKKKKSEYDDDW